MIALVNGQTHCSSAFNAFEAHVMPARPADANTCSAKYLKFAPIEGGF